MIRTLDDVVQSARQGPRMRLAVAAAAETEVLKAVTSAIELDVIEAILIGDVAHIKQIAATHKLQLARCKLVHEKDDLVAASLAVRYAREGKADFLMKGLLDTSIFLKAIIDREKGLRVEDRLLSHLVFFEVPRYHKLLVNTDGGMNMYPTLEQKAQIIKNAVQALKAMGYETIKVGCVAAKERVNPKMPATLDGHALKEMGRRGEFGAGVIVEGPISVDLAVSKESAEIKGYQSDVAGDADILLMPNIETGNAFGKTLTFLTDAQLGGIVMGATVPVVMVSRADSHQAKLNSIALGAVISANGGLEKKFSTQGEQSR